MAGRMLTTLDRSLLIKRSVEDMLHLSYPQETPLLETFGFHGEKDKFRFVNYPQTTVEFLTDPFYYPTDTLAALMDVSQTTLTATDGARYRVYQRLEIGTEQLWVTNVAGNTVTVVRGFNGSTAAAHAAADQVNLKEAAAPEGAPFQASASPDPSGHNGHFQIFSDGISISETDQLVARYGIKDTLNREIMRRMGGLGGGKDGMGKAGTLKLEMEQTFFNGTGQARTSTLPGITHGINHYLTAAGRVNDVSALSGTARNLSQPMIDDALTQAYIDGVEFATMVVSPQTAAHMARFYSDRIQTTQSETIRGFKVTEIRGQFGDVGMIASRYCADDAIYFVSPDTLGWATLRPFEDKPMGVIGDSHQRLIVGEYMFGMSVPKRNHKLEGFNYAA